MSLIISGCGPEKQIKQIKYNGKEKSKNESIIQSKPISPKKTSSKAKSILLNKYDNKKHVPNSSYSETNKHILLLDFKNRTMPKDFKIGMLEDAYDYNRIHIYIYKCIKIFCDALKEQLITTEIIDNRRLNLIKNSLSFHIDRGFIPESYRIGSINLIEKTIAIANVRFFNNNGSAEGEIYLNKLGKEWFISDLQINFNNLIIKQKIDDKKFMPSAY